MLAELSLANFKVFSKLSLGLRPLTVLTGLNNAGKSSVLQALLLAELGRAGQPSVPLNGPYGLSLGEASDVLNFDAATNEIEILLTGDGWADRFVFEVPDERAVSLRQQPSALVAGRPRFLIGTYLSAERLGPRDLLEVSPEPHSAVGRDATESVDATRLSVGHRGEYTPHVLAEYDRLQVRELIRYPSHAGEGSVPTTLGAQAELWLSEIVRPVHVQATWLPGTNAATVRFRGSDTRTEWMRPANVGFGLSYALPVVVGALVAEPGHVMIVENPEAHLHPAAQSAIGRFLCSVAASGIQIIVETHSDHVVNGIRRAVAEFHNIPADLATIYFFVEDNVSQIDIQGSGALTTWPEGFFDQAERDLMALSRVRKE